MFTSRSFLHHFGSVTQRSLKEERNMLPDASLDDPHYYRKKYGLSWLVRRKQRLRTSFLSAWWRLNESWRFGMTLRAKRRNGEFLYS